MRYVAAYLLAALGGKRDPSASDIKQILSSVGIEVEDERMNKVISELKGKKLADLIAEGNSKLASMPSGGAAPAASGGGGGAAAGGAAEEKKEEETKKKEESDSGSDDDMGFGLFD